METKGADTMELKGRHDWGGGVGLAGLSEDSGSEVYGGTRGKEEHGRGRVVESRGTVDF